MGQPFIWQMDGRCLQLFGLFKLKCIQIIGCIQSLNINELISDESEKMYGNKTSVVTDIDIKINLYNSHKSIARL